MIESIPWITPPSVRQAIDYFTSHRTPEDTSQWYVGERTVRLDDDPTRGIERWTATSVTLTDRRGSGVGFSELATAAARSPAEALLVHCVTEDAHDPSYWVEGARLAKYQQEGQRVGVYHVIYQRKLWVVDPFGYATRKGHDSMWLSEMKICLALARNPANWIARADLQLASMVQHWCDPETPVVAYARPEVAEIFSGENSCLGLRFFPGDDYLYLSVVQDDGRETHGTSLTTDVAHEIARFLRRERPAGERFHSRRFSVDSGWVEVSVLGAQTSVTIPGADGEPAVTVVLLMQCGIEARLASFLAELPPPSEPTHVLRRKLGIRYGFASESQVHGTPVLFVDGEAAVNLEIDRLCSAEDFAIWSDTPYGPETMRVLKEQLTLQREREVDVDLMRQAAEASALARGPSVQVDASSDWKCAELPCPECDGTGEVVNFVVPTACPRGCARPDAPPSLEVDQAALCMTRGDHEGMKQ